MELTFLQNRLIVAVFAGVVGVILTLLIQRILNKRGLFTYFVWHNSVGVSTDDAVFGTVRAFWNDHQVDNLWFSSIELRNASLNDYENVIVKVFTNSTALLNERTEIVGTSRVLEWTAAFANRVTLLPGSEPTAEQRSLYAREREYLVPPTYPLGVNRDSSRELIRGVRITYLNATNTPQQPTIWLDILHKGVKTEIRVAQPEFFGVPQFYAAQIGSASGIVVVALVIATVEALWLAAVLSFLYGLFVLFPGAAAIKLWRRFRDLFGG